MGNLAFVNNKEVSVMTYREMLPHFPFFFISAGIDFHLFKISISFPLIL